MELVDSRRLPGANILWRRPGAVLDVRFDDAAGPQAIEAWERSARRYLDAVGWTGEDTRTRTFAGGASLAISAPLDALYAATEVNERAWASACAQLAARTGGAAEAVDFEADVAYLTQQIAAEVNPPLVAMRAAARAHGVAFLSDDDEASVGLGTGSVTWPVPSVPAPAEVDWSAVHDVPTALITGTNGKSTTVRLLAAIASAAGGVVGVSSTDWVRVGDDVVETGDWSGPGGARRVLRDRRVEVALLETARGGMLRRGLALETCDVAAVLNVAADHLGEWGIGTLDGLAEGKFVVTSVARTVVLNADDAVVARRGRALDRERVWFSLDASNPIVTDHLRDGGAAVVLAGDRIVACRGTDQREVLAVTDVPATLGGAARYNVANALAAVAIADVLGFEPEAVRAGLRGFTSDPRQNPGRLNVFDVGGARVLVDFAHNPHGFEAIFEVVAGLPAERRLVLLGQAGDRDDESIRELVRIAWRARPDRVVIKELVAYLRGRPAGEVPALIEAELVALGAGPDVWSHAPSELDGVRAALEWARPGDLVLLLVHEDREEVLALLHDLARPDGAPGPD